MNTPQASHFSAFLILFLSFMQPVVASQPHYHPAGYMVEPLGVWNGAFSPSGLQCFGPSSNAVFECLDAVRSFNSPNAAAGSAGWQSASPSSGGLSSWDIIYISSFDGQPRNGSVSFKITRICGSGYAMVVSDGDSYCKPVEKDNMCHKVGNPVSIVSGEKNRTI